MEKGEKRAGWIEQDLMDKHEFKKGVDYTYLIFTLTTKVSI